MENEKVLEIYNKLKNGETAKDLATEYDVSQSTIASIKNGHHGIYKNSKYNLKPIPTDKEDLSRRLSIINSGKNNGMYGKKHTEESKQKISKNRSSIGGYWKGKKLPQEMRNKISKSVKLAYEEGRLVEHLSKMGNGQEMTEAEHRLSKFLPNGFINEYPVHPGGQRGSYWLDFAYKDIKLDIEVDGEQHYVDKKIIDRDKIRDDFLRSKGWTIMRFENEEILNDIENVIFKVVNTINSLENNK